MQAEDAPALREFRDRADFQQEFSFAEANVGPLESELERLFVAHWVALTLGCGSTAYGDAHLRDWRFDLPSPAFHLKSQQQIKGLRVDFLLHIKTQTGALAGSAVIECDGRQYHDTKEAFEADRLRDILMAGNGLPVFRFSWKILAEIPEALWGILQWSRRVRPWPKRGVSDAG